ncbi:MAG: adenosylcobinamide-phosphate synthase CbiB [Pseudomonadota bacterium]
MIQALLLALLIDRLIGDPDWLYRRLPHPVVMIGAMITDLERQWLHESATPREKFLSGRRTTLTVVSTCCAIGVLLQWLCLLLPFGWVLLGILMSLLIAQTSLANHVGAVAEGLDQGLSEGRSAVAHIVGRDPEQLDQHAVSRAAVESLAENYSDGVVAPVFYAFFLGLPGILGYKAINTADSMIGHRSERYLYFGRFAALLDDVVNWLPARFSAYIIVVGAWMMPGASSADARATIVRDARKHRSPNAGWPEAALSGALSFKLSGPRFYHGEATNDAWVGDGNPHLTPSDIRRAVRLFWWSCGVMAVPIILVWIGF